MAKSMGSESIDLKSMGSESIDLISDKHDSYNVER